MDDARHTWLRHIMRVRVTFSKQGWIIYSSHLDLMRAWERALRRARLPLAYSGGFNPRPKIQLARALPLGHAGEEEILDVWFETRVPLDDLAERLVPVLPEGLAVSEVQEVDEKAPAMQTQVVGTVYRVMLEWQGTKEELGSQVRALLAEDELIHERRGKRYDLRPLIEGLRLVEVDPQTGWATLWMKLSARPGATGRPEAVLDVLGTGDAFARYSREGLILAGEPEA